MANIRGTCNKDDINILARSCVCVCVCVCARARARAHVCMHMSVCACLLVCVCARARVCLEREREVYVPASVPREAALSVSFVFITTDTL